eukprot:GSChrysophyteH1.ASY1.ANO1.1585.1 assembled CDS
MEYELVKNELDKDSDGYAPSKFALVKGEERWDIGKEKGVYFHQGSGWAAESPARRLYLQQNVRYRPSDVVVATFPKCGTTLTEQVVLLLLNGGDAKALDPLSKNATNFTGKFGKVWPEVCIRSAEECALHDGTGPEEFSPKSPEWLDSLAEPRVIKTHAKVKDLLGAPPSSSSYPLQDGTKYIVCCRNPLDACVSCYYHSWNPAKKGWPFAAWVEAWVRSDEHANFGSWFSWHKDWFELYNNSDAKRQILLVHYEQMLAHPHQHVRDVAAFLNIDADQGLVDKVVEGSSFGTMKAAAVEAASMGSRNNSDAHLRAGSAFKWHSHFCAEGVSRSESERLIKIVKDAFNSSLAGSGFAVSVAAGSSEDRWA